MGPFRGCIDEAVTNREIGEGAAEVARAAYDDAYEAVAPTLGPVEADRQAAAAAIAKLESEAIEARRRRQLAIRTRRTALETIAGLKTRRGYQGVKALGGGDGSGKPPKDGWTQGGRPPEPGQPGSKGAVAAIGLKRLVENRPGLAAAPGWSMVGQYRTIRGGFDAMMADLIEAFETRTGLDRPGRAAMQNIGREAFGEDTGDAAAKALAQAWAETSEAARQMFNAVGGSIGKIDNWGFPTLHDRARVLEVGRDAWVAAELPRLDRAGMIDRATGKPFTEARLKAVLGDTWLSISSGGASKRAPGEALGKGALATTRSETRFLKYKSFADWSASQAEFGQGDLYQVMMGHLDEMAIDIAQMRVLGPNPRHQFEWLSSFARREAALEEAAGVKGARDKAEGLILEAEMMYGHFTGDLNVPVNSGLAMAGGTVRGLLTGAMLGSAVLGEIGTGFGLGRMARGFVGLSRNGDMGQLMRLLADPAERAIARRTGFIIETATDGFVRATHDNLRLMTVGAKAEGGINALGRRLPSAVIRMQGLSGIVAARKRAFRFELMGALHDVRGRTLAELAKGDARDKALGRWLDARGFTEADWTIIRAAPVYEPRPGATFLLPRQVAKPDLAARLGEAIEIETRMVSPETTLETRAWWTRDRAGTFMGELQRSTGMFKGFTATLTTLYGQEVALQAQKRGGNALVDAAGMAASALAFLTIGGAVSLQLREMAKGNDPRPMADARFWGAAMAQGGGLGIAGDFLYSAQARNGKSAQVASFGPVGQFASDSWNLTGGNVLEIGGDVLGGQDPGEAVQDARPGREAAAYVTDYNPLASLWWTRASFSRLVGDNLQRGLDPEAEAAFQRRARRMEKESGQGQWWPQGQNAPARGPDLAGAMEAAPAP